VDLALLDEPSFAKIELMCRSTARTVTNRRSAIVLLLPAGHLGQHLALA